MFPPYSNLFLRNIYAISRNISATPARTKRNIFYLQAGNKDFVREVRLLPNRNESLRPDKSIKMRSAIFMKRRNAFAGSK